MTEMRNFFRNFFRILLSLSPLGLIIRLISPKLVIRWGSKKTRDRVFLAYGLTIVIFLIIVIFLEITLNVTTSPTEQEKEKPTVTPTSTNIKYKIIKFDYFTWKEESTVVPASTIEQKKVVIPRYSVLNEDVYDAPIKTQIILNILVSGKISEPGLIALLNQLYFSIKARKEFKYHDSPTHIYIYAFTSKERAESGMGQWIAMLEKNDYIDVEPTIHINERQITQLDAKPEWRFGLSEEKRKEIWKELILAEDRARKEAEEQYPLDPTQSLRVGQMFQLSRETPLILELEPPDPTAPTKIRWLPPQTTIKVLKVVEKQQTLWYFVVARSPSKAFLGSGWIWSVALIRQLQVDRTEQLEQVGKRVELEDRLRDKYKDELAKKYGLTRKQLKEITIEGIEKDWPFPKEE